MSTRYFSLCLSFGSSPDTNHHKTLVSNRVKGGEGIKGYNEDTMNTIKLGKLAKDLKNSLHFIKFFWFAMFTRNDYSNTCQIKIKANSRISFLGCNIDWRYTPWFLWVINIPVSFSFIWNFSPYYLIEFLGRKKTVQYDPNICFHPSFSLWVKLLEIFSITSICIIILGGIEITNKIIVVIF